MKKSGVSGREEKQPEDGRKFWGRGEGFITKRIAFRLWGKKKKSTWGTRAGPRRGGAAGGEGR